MLPIKLDKKNREIHSSHQPLGVNSKNKTKMEQFLPKNSSSKKSPSVSNKEKWDYTCKKIHKLFHNPFTEYGLDNFHWVHPDIYRGGSPIFSEKSLQYLRDKYKITQIIDLSYDQKYPWQINEEHEAATNVGIKHINLSLDTPIPPTPEQFHNFIELIENNQQGSTYIHCRAGKNRTGIICALYKIYQGLLTPEAALQEMKTYGYNSNNNPKLGELLLDKEALKPYLKKPKEKNPNLSITHPAFKNKIFENFNKSNSKFNKLA